MAARIEISGILASGKSTLCNEFERHGFPVIWEDVTNNPYFKKVQEDPDKYGYLLQQEIIKDREQGIMDAVYGAGDTPYLVDYCLAADKAYLDFFVATIPDDKLQALYRSVDDVYERQGNPALVIHLRCDTDKILERIKKRGRDFELSHTKEYLRNLAEKIEIHLKFLKDRGVPVMEIDTTNKAPAVDNRFIGNVMRNMPG